MSTSPNISRVARVVAAKDLRIEMRSHIVVQQVLPFSGLVMVMFAFALDNDDVLQRVAGGLVWLATLFSLFIVVQRSYAIETSDGALDALRVAGVDSQGIFLGKSAALFVQLITLELLLFLLAIVLYQVQISLEGLVLLVTCVLCATAGLAFVGTLYGGLTAGARGRETLLPLLLLPVVAPVVLSATRATESAFLSGGAVLADGWPWVGVLAVFAALFGIGGLLSFGSLIEE
jgi:heme exporter protein B